MWRLKRDGAKKDEEGGGEKKTAKPEEKMKSAKQVYDEDFVDDLNYVLAHFTVFGSPKEVDGIKVGSVNSNGEIWMPTHSQNKDKSYKGQWVSKKEIENQARNRRNYQRHDKLTSEQKKSFPIGAKYTDRKGREFTITKHDTIQGRIRLTHKTDDGKKKHVYLSGHDLSGDLNPNLTTGFPEIDKKLRKK